MKEACRHRQPEAESPPPGRRAAPRVLAEGIRGGAAVPDAKPLNCRVGLELLLQTFFSLCFKQRYGLLMQSLVDTCPDLRFSAGLKAGAQHLLYVSRVLLCPLRYVTVCIPK